MGFCMTSSIRRPHIPQASANGFEELKGYFAVYVGDRMWRFVISISYLCY
jgi:hypothetical protein